MPTYHQIAKVAERYIARHKLFKHGVNWSPLYRRTTGKIIYVSEDIQTVRIRIRPCYRNRNYVGSIFGGSLYSAADPIPMVQLINLIGEDYIVWDKGAEIKYRKPAKEDVYAEFTFLDGELQFIKDQVAANQEFELIKTAQLTNKDESVIFCEVEKKLYVADKAYFKAKGAQNG